MSRFSDITAPDDEHVDLGIQELTPVKGPVDIEQEDIDTEIDDLASELSELTFKEADLEKYLDIVETEGENVDFGLDELKAEVSLTFQMSQKDEPVDKTQIPKWNDLDGEWETNPGWEFDIHHDNNDDSQDRRDSRKMLRLGGSTPRRRSSNLSSFTAASMLNPMSRPDDSVRPVLIYVRIDPQLQQTGLDFEILNEAKRSIRARIDTGRFENPPLRADDNVAFLRIGCRRRFEAVRDAYQVVSEWLGYLIQVALDDGVTVGIPFEIGCFKIRWFDLDEVR